MILSKFFLGNFEIKVVANFCLHRITFSASPCDNIYQECKNEKGILGRCRGWYSGCNYENDEYDLDDGKGCPKDCKCCAHRCKYFYNNLISEIV